MSKTTIIFGFILFMAVIGGVWAYSKWDAYAPKTYVTETETATGTQATTVNTATGTSTPGAQTFTLRDIASHNSASSCYSAINGKVYDLTLWINVHPGGKQAILSICGTDGSAAFNAQHGTDRKPSSILSRFYIGNLSQ